jgi:glycosyltransferase involved in cell wall biosynthesis
MKTAFISQPWNDVVPPVQSGSIAIWTYEVARRLAQSCDVVIYAKKGRHQKKAEYCEDVSYRRMSIRTDRWLQRLLNRFSTIRDVRYPLFASNFFYLGYIFQVANDLKAQQCDIAHLYNFSQFIPIIRSLNPSIKIVLHMHCDWLTQLERETIKRQLGKVDLVIGCCEYITERIRRSFPLFSNICNTIYNGTDINFFSYKNYRRNAEKNSLKRLLFVGRISPEKGLHILLDALHYVIKYHPQLQLEIAGPQAIAPMEFIVSLSNDDKVSKLSSFYQGSYFSHLQRQILSLNIAQYVKFSGFIPYTHIANHYHDADVVIQPSLSEAFPGPILEAMACGLPVVATRVGGTPESVEHEKTGLLVDSGDAPELAEAIIHLLEDEDLRIAMGQAARQRVTALFSWERVTEDLWHHYQNLCG